MTSYPSYSQKHPLAGSTLLDSLPAEARRKLSAIKSAASDARALEAAAQDDVRQHRENIRFLEAERDRLTAQAEKHRDDEAAGKAEAKQHEIDLVQEELAHSDQLARSRSGRFENNKAVARSIEAWISHQHGKRFEAVKTKPHQLKGENLTESLERVRSDLTSVLSERERIRTAPVPAADRKAHIRANIEALAIQPTVTGLIGGDVQIDIMPPRPLEMKGPISTRGVEGLMCWLHVDAKSDPETEISEADKAKLDAEFPAKILALERQEEALVEAMIAAGIDVRRRPEASPEAILGVVEAEHEEVEA